MVEEGEEEEEEWYGRPKEESRWGKRLLKERQKEFCRLGSWGKRERSFRPLSMWRGVCIFVKEILKRWVEGWFQMWCV